jgi:hypothetical protein
MSLQGGGGAVKGVIRSSSQLYRDCLRLIYHMAGIRSKKAQQLRIIVRNEFRKNAAVAEQDKIDALKANAVRALANYLMLESSTKDPRLMNRSSAFVSKEADSIKNMKE